MCLSRQREWERVPYVTLRIDFGSLLTIPSSLIVSSNDFSFFSVFLIIPFIFPHFTDSSVHHASSLLGQLDDLNWYMLFLSSISRKMTHTHPATVSVSFWSRMFPTLCCPKCIKWYQYFRHTNRMKLLNISFWWLFYAKTMSIMILWPDWIEKRIKSSDQHTRTQKHMESLPRLKNDAFGQRLPSIRSIFDTVGRDFGRKYARIM